MSWSTNPAEIPFLNELLNFKPASSLGDNTWNNIFRSFGKGGESASNAAFYAPATMQAGERGEAIESGKGLGGVGKESAAGGGDQWNMVGAAKNTARTAGGGEQAGYGAATAQGVGEGTSYNDQRQQQAIQDTLQSKQDYFSDLSKGSKYETSPWASFLPNLLSGGIKGAMGGLGGIGGGGGSEEDPSTIPGADTSFNNTAGGIDPDDTGVGGPGSSAYNPNPYADWATL